MAESTVIITVTELPSIVEVDCNLDCQYDGEVEVFLEGKSQGILDTKTTSTILTTFEEYGDYDLTIKPLDPECPCNDFTKNLKVQNNCADLIISNTKPITATGTIKCVDSDSFYDLYYKKVVRADNNNSTLDKSKVYIYHDADDEIDIYLCKTLSSRNRPDDCPDVNDISILPTGTSSFPYEKSRFDLVQGGGTACTGAVYRIPLTVISPVELSYDSENFCSGTSIVVSVPITSYIFSKLGEKIRIRGEITGFEWVSEGAEIIGEGESVQMIWNSAGTKTISLNRIYSFFYERKIQGVWNVWKPTDEYLGEIAVGARAAGDHKYVTKGICEQSTTIDIIDCCGSSFTPIYVNTDTKQYKI